MKAEEPKHPCKNNTFPQCSKKISKKKIYRQKYVSLRPIKTFKETKPRMRKDK